VLHNSLPITDVIAIQKLITKATKLFSGDSQTSTYAFDLVPHNFHGEWLLVDSIGGEASSAANDCVKLFEHTDLASLQFDPGGYLSGGFVFYPDSFLQFNPHRFIDSTSALSSGETIGHQHPLFLQCPTLLSLQYVDGATEITKCSKFFNSPNFISICCSIPCMVRKYLMISQQQPQELLWLNG